MDKMSRRRFLGGAIAVGTVAGLGKTVEVLNKIADEPRHEGPAEDASLPENESLESGNIPAFLTLEKRPRRYDTSALAGETFGYPISEYFGHADKFTAATDIDFKYQLALMWAKKARAIGIMHAGDAPRHTVLENYKATIAKHANDPRVRTMNDIVMGYDPDNTAQMSMAEYYLQLGETIQKTKAEIDWQRAHSFFKLSGDQNAFFRSAVDHLDAQTLFAFNVTELMPELSRAHHKVCALDVFDTLLKTAGYDYIARIPSGGDLEISFGPGQVTPVLFQRGKNEGSLTKMSRLLKNPLLPEDIAHLKGAQHHIASYLDAMFNLGVLSKKLPDERARKFAREPIADDIRLFISGAHNNPAAAIESFNRFTSAYLLAQKHHARPGYAAFAGKQIKEYVDRTKTNLADLRMRGGLSYAQAR